jgi:8-oxo-dGTP pyrophosphatase MutT (NUDIX family)
VTDKNCAEYDQTESEGAWNPGAPIHETLEGDVGAYSIQWAFEKDGEDPPLRVEWALFEVAAGADENHGPLYKKPGAKGAKDWTDDIGKAQPCVTGFVKWDGCTQWWQNDDPQHVDSRNEFHAFAMAMVKARHRALALMREHGRHVDEPDQVVEMEVVCALITGPNGSILMQDRLVGHGKLRPGMLEWPGGKVDIRRNEDPRAALVRELTEELGPEWESAAVIGQVFQLTMHVEVLMRLTGYAVALPKELALKIAAQEEWMGAEGQRVRWVGLNKAILYESCTPGTYMAYRDVLRWIQQRGRKG